MDNMKHRRLQELDRSDFDIVEGEPDIRGWDVCTADGKKIGEVEELIVDAQQKRVRYMVVELDDDEADLEDEKKVLVPIGLAELDKDEDDVILPSASVAQLASLPAYDSDNLDEAAEQRISMALGRGADTFRRSGNGPHHTSTPEEDYDFYRHEHFHDNLYRNRQKKSPSKQQDRQESDYEQGLRLWEMRSEGGIVEGDTQRRERERDITDEKRMEIRRDRRRQYEERRGKRKGSTIIDRINKEGLQDAGLSSNELS